MRRSIVTGLAFLAIFGEWELTGHGGFGAGVFFALGTVLLGDGYRRWRDKD